MTTETSLEFVEKLEAFYGDNSESMSRLLRLAKTAALIEDHRLGINPWSAYWDVQHRSGHYTEADDLHTAVRAVADRIRDAILQACAEEREACAKICRSLHSGDAEFPDWSGGFQSGCEDCEEAIRGAK